VDRAVRRYYSDMGIGGYERDEKDESKKEMVTCIGRSILYGNSAFWLR